MHRRERFYGLASGQTRSSYRSFWCNYINDAGARCMTFSIPKVCAQRQLTFRNEIMLHCITLGVRPFSYSSERSALHQRCWYCEKTHCRLWNDPLQLKLRVARNLSNQRDSKGSFINRSSLLDPEIGSNFREIVLKHLELIQEDLTHPALRDAVHASSAKDVLSSSERRRQGWFSESHSTLMAGQQYLIAIRLR